MARQGLERQGRHELHGPAGHDDMDGKTALDKQANQLYRLITGNTAGDPQDDTLALFFFSVSHSLKIANHL